MRRSDGYGTIYVDTLLWMALTGGIRSRKAPNSKHERTLRWPATEGAFRNGGACARMA